MARSYQDFEPDHHYRKGEVHDIIELQVKDFRKEHLKVNFGSNGVLTITGERPVEGHRWIRFRKEFNPPKDCKSNEIRARLSSGILYLTIPKKVVQQDQVTPVQQGSQVQDKGKLKQESSKSNKEGADQGFTAKQQSDVAMPTENGALQPTAGPKSFVSRLKMGRKTAMKVGASVIVLALLIAVMFYVLKYYATMIIVDQ
ncbi:hypothetical protein CCACVL1_20201 [Corchorus capsularis]|uniref:SHSP domain-containing protein n=1 Tax=Corchorus capsularis TaxID=210143 RepID=A0A1R3HC32_COCAP|nr:hypothetical protein CCACVL1_20201 [Corchorus capsularis]